MSYPNRPAPPRNKALVPCGIACGCIVLAIIIVVALSVSAFRTGSASIKQAGTTAEQFLTALEHQDEAGVMAAMSAQEQGAKAKEALADAMEVATKRHGRPVSHKQQPSFDVKTNNGVATMRLTYQETFEKGEAPVQITLTSEGGKWKVSSFDFQ